MDDKISISIGLWATIEVHVHRYLVLCDGTSDSRIVQREDAFPFCMGILVWYYDIVYVYTVMGKFLSGCAGRSGSDEGNPIYQDWHVVDEVMESFDRRARITCSPPCSAV